MATEEVVALTPARKELDDAIVPILTKHPFGHRHGRVHWRWAAIISGIYAQPWPNRRSMRRRRRNCRSRLDCLCAARVVSQTQATTSKRLRPAPPWPPWL